MKFSRSTSWLAWFWCAVGSVASAAIPFHVDSFQSGTFEGWIGGAPRTNIPDGGPGGMGDRFLHVESLGGFGPGANMATHNDGVPWTGNFDSARIRGVLVDMMVPMNQPQLDMRLVLFGSSLTANRWTSTIFQTVPADGAWRSYLFRVGDTHLTRVQGIEPYSTMIVDVFDVMLRYDPGSPSSGGTGIVAQLGIDNVRLVPEITCQTFDNLVAAIVAGANDPTWDLNRDTVVNLSDLDTLRVIGGKLNLVSGAPYLPGDANLDGMVDSADFAIWHGNEFTSRPGWCAGDFNADGAIDGSDFGLWNQFKTPPSLGVQVPEVHGWCAMVIIGSCIAALRGRSGRSENRRLP